MDARDGWRASGKSLLETRLNDDDDDDDDGDYSFHSLVSRQRYIKYPHFKQKGFVFFTWNQKKISFRVLTFISLSLCVCVKETWIVYCVEQRSKFFLYGEENSAFS